MDLYFYFESCVFMTGAKYKVLFPVSLCIGSESRKLCFSPPRLSVRKIPLQYISFTVPFMIIYTGSMSMHYLLITFK